MLASVSTYRRNFAEYTGDRAEADTAEVRVRPILSLADRVFPG